MQEILIVLCGVAGVAAAALIRRGRRVAGSALRSERNTLRRAVSLLERDPAYASERQELLPGYQARLKEVERTIAGGGRTPDSATIPREERDAVADAPGHAVIDGDAGGAGEPGAGEVPGPATQGEVAAVPGVPEPPEAGGGPGADTVPAAAPDTHIEDAAVPDIPEPPDVGGEPGAGEVPIPATQGEVAAVPDVPEPPEAGGGPGADTVPAAAPDTHIEDAAVPDIPEPPGGEPDAEAPPSAHSTPDTPETGHEAEDTKMPQAAVPVEPHADTIPQPGNASAAGGVGNEAGRNALGKGPDSTADVEQPPDTPAAAPPMTPAGDASTLDRAGTGTSDDAPSAIDPKDIHKDTSGRPGEGRTEGDGPAPPDPDGDGSEDLEKIKADIIKTLNRLQRAEDD